jgi:8-oxo-dGTP diphosphatase
MLRAIHRRKMKEYTVGFLFNKQGNKVALVKKNRPEWQRGRWNGIGGKFELGETPMDCMVREFREETGVEIKNWKKFAEISGIENKVPEFNEVGFRVHFFYAYKDDETEALRSNTDEEIAWWYTCSMPHTLPNLDWLIPMALSMKYHTREYVYKIDEVLNEPFE